MSDIASKNLYELLGNTSDEDPDREIPPPVQPVDKPVARAGKRNAGGEPPVRDAAAPEATRGSFGGRGGGRGGRGGRRENFTGNEQAFRDRDAGRMNNREKTTDEAAREDRNSNRETGGRPSRGSGYEGRGGRGSRGGRGGRDDRHSRNVTGAVPNDHAKQAAHGWGEETGVGELKDEQAGQAIAWEEEKKGYGTLPDEPANADGDHPAVTEAAPAEDGQPEAEPEPEDKTKSYATYLAELAEKKLGLGGLLTARQANEGTSKKMPEGKEMSREETADYFAGSGGKARRERERKEKNVYVLDHDIQAREREAFRGGRGGRGRGRGEGGAGFRGEGRGRGGGRGRGEGRGDGYRSEGRGEGRGEYRGNRGGRVGGGGSAATPNVTNDADFPTLGK